MSGSQQVLAAASLGFAWLLVVAGFLAIWTRKP